MAENEPKYLAEAADIWAEFLGHVKPRKARTPNPYPSLKEPYPFKHVRPFSIGVHERLGNRQIMQERFQLNGRSVSNLARDKRAHPEKPAYQNLRRKIRAERNDVALAVSDSYVYGVVED